MDEKSRAQTTQNCSQSLGKEISEALRNLRKNKFEAVRLVELLEGNSFKKGVHDLEFCQSYVVKLIQKYCRDASVYGKKEGNRGRAKGTAADRAELMLAACGLLCGFEFDSKTIGPRMAMYCRSARYCNSSLEGDWEEGSLGTIYRTQLYFIEIELVEDLVEEKKRKKERGNNGKLGLIDQIPPRLILPKPRCISTDLLPQRLQPEADAEPKSEADAEPKPEADAEPKPEADAEPKPEADAEPKPEPTLPSSSPNGHFWIIYKITHITHIDLIVIAIVIIAICTIISTVYNVKDFYRKNAGPSSQPDNPNSNIETRLIEDSDEISGGTVSDSLN